MIEIILQGFSIALYVITNVMCEQFIIKYLIRYIRKCYINKWTLRQRFHIVCDILFSESVNIYVKVLRQSFFVKVFWLLWPSVISSMTLAFLLQFLGISWAPLGHLPMKSSRQSFTSKFFHQISFTSYDWNYSSRVLYSIVYDYLCHVWAVYHKITHLLHQEMLY